ncbi:MAG: SUMF1/EgtB/PvdO family nonheme iron enzyme [Paludibacteraceae bacterium]|nr:SUMF1/EgtB/PvdO family nonheme iron enzyme [Paludibacteraceae bacterium]
MKVAKLLSIAVLVLGVVSCNPPAGELVGSRKSKEFQEAVPYGMVFVKKGSLMMGANSQSALFSQPDNNVMVSVNAFWMDDTEITNNEYKQFVDWVRDSIAYSLLIEEDGGESEYAIPSPYEDEEAVRINWKKKIPYEKRFLADDPVATALEPLFYDNGRGSLRTTKLKYRYSWEDVAQAKKHANRFDVALGRYRQNATVKVDTFWVENEEIFSKTITRPLREPKDIVTNSIICVYPDTMVWARDFEYAYNDPLLTGYFSMPGYSEYPVVGVTWEQAHAFCHWRSDLLTAQQGPISYSYRLPTEAEWEYAARGGRKMAMYPWGDKYARSVDGCFFANFKPYRGSYHNDTGTSTMPVAQFPPNDFGLFDMAGNVAEWTSSAFSNSANVSVHDMNPEFPYVARKSDPDVLKRKVIRGGSWKDVSYFLQCGVRTYEYQYESRSYIGFRCVRSYVGS